MSVFIPQEWETDKQTDLSDYATKNDLLNYVEKKADGSVDLNSKKLTGLARPTDNLDAVNKEYLQENKSKPMICITAEAVGALSANKSCFSFGAKSFNFADNNGGNNGSNGVVMPTSGRIKYFSVCSTNSSGNAPPRHSGLSFAILINNTTNVDDPSQTATIPTGQRLTVKQFDRPYAVNAGDRINFWNMNNSPFSFITVASVFIELDVV